MAAILLQHSAHHPWAADPRLGQALPQGLSPPSSTQLQCTHGCSAWGGCAAAAPRLCKHTCCPWTGIAGAQRLGRACRAAPSSFCNLAASHLLRGVPPTPSLFLSPFLLHHKPAIHRDQVHVSLLLAPPSQSGQPALGPWQKGLVLLPCPGQCQVPWKQWAGRHPVVNQVWLLGLGCAASVGCRVVAFPQGAHGGEG